MTPKRKQIREGLDAARAVARSDTLLLDAMRMTSQRRHQDDGVRRRDGQSANRSGAVSDRAPKPALQADTGGSRRRPIRSGGHEVVLVRDSEPDPSCAACGAARAIRNIAFARIAPRAATAIPTFGPLRFSTDRRHVSQYSSKKRSGPASAPTADGACRSAPTAARRAAAASPRSSRCPAAASGS